MKILICLLAGLTAMSSWAQSSGNVAPPGPTGRMESSGATAPANPVGKPETSLQQVHDRLRLSSQQEGLWGQYEGRVESYTSAYYRQKPIGPSPQDPAPHQIARMVDNLQNRLAALEEVEAAAKNLYNSLTTEQQTIANQMLILAIPMFAQSGDGSNQSSSETRRKDGKPDAGKKLHRSGAGANL